MKRVVLMDVDGVIANTAYLVYQADIALLERLGIRPVSWEDYRTKYVTRNDFEKVFGLLGRDKEWLEVFQQFEHLTEPYPEAPEFIAKLKRDEFKLGIVSAASGRRIANFLQKYTLETFFDAIVTREDLEGKEKEEGLVQAMNNLGARISECVYVGDTRGDHLSAKNVGIDFIGVAWGLHSPEIIKREGDCIIADDFDSLYISIKTL